MVEALHSYFARLAALHCMSPSSLFGELALRNGLNRQLPHLTGIYWPRTFDAISEATRLDLGALTARRSIHIRKEGLYRPAHAWCSLCVEEFGLGHYPLLWQVAAVTVCHIHHTGLITHCPSCRCQMFTVAGLTEFRCGECHYDIRRGAAGAGGTDSEIKTTSLVAELLASPIQTSPVVHTVPRMRQGPGRRLTDLIEICRQEDTTLVELLHRGSDIVQIIKRRAGKSVSVTSIYEKKFEDYKLRQSRELDLFSMNRIESDFGVCYRTAQKWRRAVASDDQRARRRLRGKNAKAFKKLAFYRSAVQSEFDKLIANGASPSPDIWLEAERRVIATKPRMYCAPRMLMVARKCLLAIVALGRSLPR